MIKSKYLIVGGGVAGTTAAETIRKNDKESAISIVSDEPYRFYSRILLSKPAFFLGKISADSIWLKTQAWYEDNKIQLIAGKKAVSLDASKKILSLEDGTEIEYEKLLLAVGAYARKWNVEGANKKGVHYFRTLDDTRGIMAAFPDMKSAVLIGSGFVSYETADLLRMAGKDVTIIMLENYYWQPLLDETSGKMIESVLEKNGVKIMRKQEVQKVIGDEKVEGVLLKDGTRVDCDAVIAGIGVVCDLDWLKSVGLNINKGILANEFMATNLSDVYTAGDVAEFNDLILEETVQLGNWVNAQEHGRTASMNMLGIKTAFKFVSFYTAQGFGLSMAFVGDCRQGADRIIIPRGSLEANSYSRIIIVGKELVGATMINRTGEISVISKLIECNVDVSLKYKELGDPSFDLNQLLS